MSTTGMSPRLSELATVTHDGKVVVVSSGADGLLRYTVRQSGFENSAVSPVASDAPHGFEQWKSVPLDRAADDPSVVSFERDTLTDRSGQPIVRSIYGVSAILSSKGRVKLLSCLGHIYIFRVSASTNRLLMNRFVLDGMTNELVPKLEVRYRRSGQKLAPEGGIAGSGAVTLDTLAFRDTAHKPFFEPAKELSFLGGFDPQKPWFSVELISTGEHEKYRWNFFVFTDSQLRLMSVATSAEGLIDPMDQRKTEVNPDKVDRKITTTVPGIVDRTIELPGPVVNGFDSTVYHNQVARMTKSGEQLLKDSTRVMLAVPVKRLGDNVPSVAALSFTVGQLGLLARVVRSGTDELLIGKAKEVLLPLTDLEEIKLIADRTPPPSGSVLALQESASGDIAIKSDTNFADGLSPQAGTDVDIWGTRSFDGTYVASNVDEQAGTFELNATFDAPTAANGSLLQGHWEVADDEAGLSFENMIVGYELNNEGRLKVTCTSHNLREGDEIRIEGTRAHDGVFPISDVDEEENSFVIDKSWPAGEVVNFSIRNRRGLAFDGQGDYLLAGPVELEAYQVDKRLERTVSTWVHLDSVTGKFQTLFVAESELLSLFVDADGHLSSVIEFADGHSILVAEPEPLPIGRWIHVTVMIDYEGDSTGRTSVRLLNDGLVTLSETIEPRKPVHLPMRNLHLSGEALPMTTVRYDTDETRSLTIEAWLLPTGGGRHVVASWCQHGLFELAVSHASGNRRIEWVTNGDSITSATTLIEQRWHHVAATFNPTTGRRTIVLDGVLDSEDNTEQKAGAFLSVKDAAAIGRPFVAGALGAGMVTVPAQGRTVALLTLLDGRGWKQIGERSWIEVDPAGEQVGEPYREQLRDDWRLRLHRDRDDLMIDYEEGQVFVTRSSVLSMTMPWVTNNERSVADIASFEWHVDTDSEARIIERFDRISDAYWELTRADGRVEAYQEYHRSGESIWLNFHHDVNPEGEPSALWSTWAQINFSRGVFMLQDIDHGTLYEIVYREPVEPSVETLHTVPIGDGHAFELEHPVRRVWVERLNGEVIRKLTETPSETDSIIELRAVDEDRRIVVNTSEKTWTSFKQIYDTFLDVEASDLNRTPARSDRYIGALADVRVWSKIRNPVAIAASMATGLSGAEAGLVAYWPLDETSAGQSSDLTKNKIHLELSGMGVSEILRRYTKDLLPAVAQLPSDPLAGSPAESAIGEAVERLVISQESLVLVTANDADKQLLAQSLAYRLLTLDTVFERALVVDNKALQDTAPDITEFRRWITDLFNLKNTVVIQPDLDQSGWVQPDLFINAMNARQFVTVAIVSRSTLINLPGSWPVSNVFNMLHHINVAELVSSDSVAIPAESPASEAVDVATTVAVSSDTGVLEQSAASAATAESSTLAMSAIENSWPTAEPGPWYSTPHRAPGRMDNYGGKKFAERYWIASAPYVRATFKGKLSELEVWTVNPTPEQVRERRHLPLQGNEYGLLHNWRCGGIIADKNVGSEHRLIPDMGPGAIDALVFGDVFVSARDLPRRNSAGLAVRYSNDDLVAVSQGGQYRETFEFRARSSSGEPWSLADVNDVAETGRRIFRFRYWGQSSRTSEERVEFEPDEGGEADFEPVEGHEGWYRASARFTVPNDINLIRCFDIDEVRGLSGHDDDDDEAWSEDEWAALSIRRHQIALISDAVTRASYHDDLKHLALLNDNGEALQQAKADLPVMERRQARLLAEIADIDERLKWFPLREQLLERQRMVSNEQSRLHGQISVTRQRRVTFRKDPFNYYLRIMSDASGKWMTVDGDELSVDGDSSHTAALFEVEPAEGDEHRIRLFDDGRVMAVRDRVEKVHHSRKERFLGFLWKTDTVRWTTTKKIDNEVYLIGKAVGDSWQLKKMGNASYKLLNRVHEVALTDLGALARSFFGSMFEFNQVHGVQDKGVSGQRWTLDPLDSMPQRANKMLLSIESRLDSLIARHRKKSAELEWIAEVLSMNSDAESQLLSKRRNLVLQLNVAESEILNIHNTYSDLESSSSPATMDLVAQDQNGLTTYGSLLRFVSPATALSAAAIAEGNVQLGYFDTQGRMKLTHYDATSDSSNATYEQWLGAKAALCIELDKPTARLDLIDTDGHAKPIELAGASHTVEAWFRYPPPVRTTNSENEDMLTSGPGLAYPLAFFTSDAEGTESALAIASGRRLGTVVDGFFHDAGVDLEARIDPGWHHVAARTESETVAFFLDGELVGSVASGGRPAVHACLLDRATPGLLVPGRDLRIENDVSLQVWCRVFSEGRQNARWVELLTKFFGAPLFVQLKVSSDTSQLIVSVKYNRSWSTGTVLSLPHYSSLWRNFAVTVANGIVVIYLDGVEIHRRSIPADFNTADFWLGEKSSASFSESRLELADLKVWRRALSSSEVADQMYASPESEDDSLAGHWPMATTEENGQTLVRNHVLPADTGASQGHLHISGYKDSSRRLSPVVSKPIVALGNSMTGGSPAGRLAGYRFWSQPLTDEEIRANAVVEVTGNEPDLEAAFSLDKFDQNEAKSLAGYRRVRLQQGRVTPSSAAFGHPGIRVAEFKGDTGMTLDDVKLAGSFTVEFWLRRPVDRLQVIVEHGEGPAIWTIGSFWDGRLWFYLQDQTIWFDSHDASERWTHITGVYEARAGYIELYVNGSALNRVSTRAAGDVASSVLKLCPPARNRPEVQAFQMSQFRLWNTVRTPQDIRASYTRVVNPLESGLVVSLALNERFGIDEVVNPVDGTPVSFSDENRPPRSVRVDDLPIVPAAGLVSAEYNTVGQNPEVPEARRAILRRFYGFVDASGGASLMQGKRIEELVLKWIGNAQFEPTLLGYIEGAPPVPSENLTVDTDYDGATSVELVMTDEVEYTWNRSTDIGGGLDINAFLGVGWGVEGGIGLVTKISEGHAGIRGSARTEWRRSADSRISARSTTTSRDELELRGSMELDPHFAHLGNRYVPKNVGYALVVAGMADVFITQMKRSNRMVGYEVQPAEDMPPDVNTITFLINPAYTLNGSLDGLVGSHAADERFYRHVPQMRAEHGSRYPASYYNLKQAYDLKRSIERWDKERESYFAAFESEKVMGLDDGLLNQIPAAGDDQGSDLSAFTEDVSISPRAEGDTRSDSERADEDKELLRKKFEETQGEQEEAVKKRTDDIERRFADKDKQTEAGAAFKAWQRKMEGLQLRAAKRNIQNTYVWDADGGIHYEEEDYANTIEHTIGGSFTLDASLGLDINAQISQYQGELQAMETLSMSQTMSKSRQSTKSFELNVRLDRVERRGVTGPDDMPIHPGEKVDRYRFMSFYLEGDTNHFSDFFNQVVDPEWLMSNDEEARALRQVARGKPNKTWRVLHRVTYVERPALMGFGRDLRASNDVEQATQQVYSYFDTIEKDNAELRAQVASMNAELQKITAAIGGLAKGGMGNDDVDPRPGDVPAVGPVVNGPTDNPADDPNARREPGLSALNRARKKELESLVGIGPSLASDILNWREARGQFNSINELTEIAGIGPVLVEKLRLQLEAEDG